MKQFYLFGLLRKRTKQATQKTVKRVPGLVLCLIFLLAGQGISAQVTVELGVQTGQSSTNVLLSTSTTTNKYSRTISLYTAAEIMAAGGMAGDVTSLSWLKGGVGEYTFANAYIKVYLKHVTNEQWGTSPVPNWDTEVMGASEVFTSSTYSIPTGTGWKEVAFTTPFEWNGTDNIAVFVEWYRPSTPTGDISWGRSTNTMANASRVGSTSLNALVMLVNSNRPLVQFTIESSAACPAPTALGVNEVTTTSADLQWTSAGTLFDIEWGETGFIQGTGTMVNGVTSPHELQGLDPFTQYSFYVRRNCGGTDGVSTWAGPFTFTTMCDAAAPTGDNQQDFVTGETLADLEVTGSSLIWYANPGLTSQLSASVVLIHGTTYYVTANDGVCQSQALAVTVNNLCNGLNAPTGSTAQNFTTGETLADLDVTGNNLTWYTNQDLTTELPDTTMLTHGATYFVTASNDFCESTAFAVTVTDLCNGLAMPEGNAEQEYITGATLADIDVTGDNLTWYADAELTTELPDTTVLNHGTTYYVTANNGVCESAALAITVSDLCDGLTVPGGNTAQDFSDGDTLGDLDVDGDNLTWYADEDLATEIPDTTVLEDGATYYVTDNNGICESLPLAVTVTNPCAGMMAPEGEAIQILTEGQTLADLDFSGEDGAVFTWYSDEELTMVIDPDMMAVNGTTYYVTQTIGGCVSAPLAITVETTASAESFSKYAFTVYPNPVNDILNLRADAAITDIRVFNMLGQQVAVPVSNNNTEVTMSGLAAGNYIMHLNINGIAKTVKIVKQ